MYKMLIGQPVLHKIIFTEKKIIKYLLVLLHNLYVPMNKVINEDKKYRLDLIDVHQQDIQVLIQ